MRFALRMPSACGWGWSPARCLLSRCSMSLSPYGQIVVVPGPYTTTYENLYSDHGRVQYIRGVAAEITPGDIPQAWRSAPLVHFAPIAGEADDPTMLDLFPDATIMATLQGWLRRWDDDGRVRFRRWNRAETLRRLSILVFSEEDIVEAPELLDELGVADPQPLLHAGGTRRHPLRIRRPLAL
ncbi:MAG: hypothetical protein HND48_26375 [Chloroflexi bacterium]|nr:hypothetical protein [Chloroflexota bacterium]